MAWERQVFSQNVVTVGYQDNPPVMTVEWKSGRISAYEGVPEETADEVSRAPSVTTAINSMIKPNYPHRYIK